MTHALALFAGALFVALGGLVTRRQSIHPAAESAARILFVMIGALIWRLA